MTSPNPQASFISMPMDWMLPKRLYCADARRLAKLTRDGSPNFREATLVSPSCLRML